MTHRYLYYKCNVVAMKQQAVFTIRKSTVETAIGWVESGMFDTVSDVYNYCLRSLLDHVEVNGLGNLIHLPRTETIQRSMRINKYVLDELTEKGFWTRRGDILDYAIIFYESWRMGKN